MNGDFEYLKHHMDVTPYRKRVDSYMEVNARRRAEALDRSTTGAGETGATATGVHERHHGGGSAGLGEDEHESRGWHREGTDHASGHSTTAEPATPRSRFPITPTPSNQGSSTGSVTGGNPTAPVGSSHTTASRTHTVVRPPSVSSTSQTRDERPATRTPAPATVPAAPVPRANPVVRQQPSTLIPSTSQPRGQ